MATFDAFVVPDPTPVFAAKRGTARGGFVAEQSSVTTYFYFTAAGAFGSTTDPRRGALDRGHRADGDDVTAHLARGL